MSFTQACLFFLWAKFPQLSKLQNCYEFGGKDKNFPYSCRLLNSDVNLESIFKLTDTKQNMEKYLFTFIYYYFSLEIILFSD